jgi:hypothetical protein
MTTPSEAPDLLNNETLFRPVSPITQHAPMSNGIHHRNSIQASHHEVAPPRYEASSHIPLQLRTKHTTSVRYAGPPTVPSQSLTRQPTPSSIGPSITSHVTTPDAGEHIHQAPHRLIDRIQFTRAYLPARNLPVRVSFLRRYRHARRPGARGQVTRWLLRLNETFPGTFAQWQIALQPGEYIFEDFGNSLTIMAQKNGDEPILLSFPVATSPAWSAQGIVHNGKPRALTILDHLQPCTLPCVVSRGPRVGGFLHPACYGVPGDNDTTKASRQAVYVPTTVFDGDGLIITSSYSAAYYRGRSASYLARGGV